MKIYTHAARKTRGEKYWQIVSTEVRRVVFDDLELMLANARFRRANPLRVRIALFSDPVLSQPELNFHTEVVARGYLTTVNKRWGTREEKHPDSVDGLLGTLRARR